MMKTLMKIGLGMLMLAVLLTGISFGILRAQEVEGDLRSDGGKHNLTSETRKVDANVTSIDMNGSVDLVVKQGAAASMVVRATQAMLPHIKTVQDGNTLRIDVEEKGFHFHVSQPMRVELTLPTLQQLTSHGSGDAEVSGFNGDKLALATHGSGDIHFRGQYQHVNADTFGSGDMRLVLGNVGDVALNLQGSGDISTSGQSKSLSAQLHGSGDLDASGMPADAVKVDLLGSGDAAINAKQSIVADLNGSGDLEVRGNPAHREVSTHGSGEIDWKND